MVSAASLVGTVRKQSIVGEKKALESVQVMVEHNQGGKDGRRN